MKNILLQSLTVVAVLLSSPVFSVQVSQAQIAQFKSMSPSQQKALAKSMGVDISGLTGGGAKSLSQSAQTISTPVQPRPVKKIDVNDTNTGDEFSVIASQKKLQPFGYDIFANAPSTFNPVSNIAVPESYILGVGDQISLQIFGKQSAEYLLEVSREGRVFIPDLGPFQIAGLSFSEMKRYLVAQIKERIIGVDAVISLSQLKTIRVFVLGDAYKAGAYTISSLSSISHALITAGGVNNIGSLRNIQLKRAGKLVQTFDLYDLLIHGDSTKDVLLQSGDVVFIAHKGKTISIAGQVRRPAIYELINNETIADAFAMAGGLLANAYKESVTIERISDSLRTVINLNLTNKNDSKQIAQDGDYINVMEKAQMFNDSISLIGAVARPGKYQWQKGLKVADLIKNINTSVLVNADLMYSLVVREVDIARNIEVHQFSLAKALTDVNSLDNITLSPNDKIVVFSQVEKLSEELVTLDKLAFTQRDLLTKEKQLAKEKFNDKQFWNKYGQGNNQYTEVESQTDSDNDNLFNKSVIEISAESSDKVQVSQQAIFSRQRLLGPINQQLIRQSASGDPLQLIEIDGQVKFPGTYPLAVNNRVNDLVIAAGGITESAYLTRIDITRNSVESLEAKKQNIQVNLAQALKQHTQDNILLESKDRIQIHQIPAWTKNHTIELKGEFVFPGKYSIQRGDTLSDIIARAGGFTDYAYIAGSVFTREKLRELEQQNIVKLTEDLRVEFASKSLTEDSAVNYSESQNLLNDLTKLKPVGRLVIQLDKVLAENTYDILLESGDVLYVPSWKNSVNVIGQVQVTSSHVYEAGLNIENYISKSGGVKKRADQERIYIISANGSIQMVNQSSWFSDGSSNGIKAGDTIVVPLDSDYMANIDLWSTATSIIYNSAIAVAAIGAL